MHLLHPMLHVEDDLDSGEIDAEMAGQGQDDLEPLDGVRVVEPRVAFRPGRAQQAFPLVHAEGLGMDPVFFGDRPDAKDARATAGLHRGLRDSTGIACPFSVFGATTRRTPERSVALIRAGSSDPGTGNSRVKAP